MAAAAVVAVMAKSAALAAMADETGLAAMAEVMCTDHLKHPIYLGVRSHMHHKNKGIHLLHTSHRRKCIHNQHSRSRTKQARMPPSTVSASQHCRAADPGVAIKEAGAAMEILAEVMVASECSSPTQPVGTPRRSQSTTHGHGQHNARTRRALSFVSSWMGGCDASVSALDRFRCCLIRRVSGFPTPRRWLRNFRPF